MSTGSLRSRQAKKASPCRSSTGSASTSAAEAATKPRA
jgi:hypothetical protein